jgi:hypothetical protein
MPDGSPKSCKCFRAFPGSQSAGVLAQSGGIKLAFIRSSLIFVSPPLVSEKNHRPDEVSANFESAFGRKVTQMFSQEVRTKYFSRTEFFSTR